VAFEKGASPSAVWRRHFLWLSIHYFAGASAALLLIVGLRQFSVAAIAAIVPLILISYLTFWAVHGRISDGQKHLADLDRLYLSTVETLATAIDAKDGVTHDHIRRVQSMAVALTRALGVADEAALKAIHAAALLHDTGKLAVPEHILNKPGKLTPAEFEQMKRHAAIGAEILSAVEFPYPVVPIVRHHHESWDGTGYPDGLKGDAIPLGARILSVVDCYDALTSDRPYRRALSDDDALAIVCERRGTMYDPAVVDAFVALQARLERGAAHPPRHLAALADIARSTSPAPAPVVAPLLDDATEEMLALCALAQSLSPDARLADAGLLVWLALKRLLPSASAMALYALDAGRDEVVVRYASGQLGSMVDHRIATGQRLSGWVAQHWEPLVNSDADLDLGELARACAPPLRSCLSVPLTLGASRLVGVLTVYSAADAGFLESQARMIQMVAPHVAEALDPLLAASHVEAPGRTPARAGLKLVSVRP
jgi:putative nucleotidyltransferase with HDIG domain